MHVIKIYSKIQPNKLLHIVYDCNNVTDRIDLIPDEEFLQCSVVRKDSGKKFKEHKHIAKPIKSVEQIAQESWFVYKGNILVYHYDIDDSLIGTMILKEGQINITLYGGHTLEILEDNTIICEQKNGPYYGQKLDKVFIGENKNE